MILLVILGILLLFVGWSALIAFIVMLAWNAVMPPLFHVTTFTFLQAWAFMFLVHLVLGTARAVVNVSTQKN